MKYQLIMKEDNKIKNYLCLFWHETKYFQILFNYLQEMSQHAVPLDYRNALHFYIARNTQIYLISDRMQKSVGFRDILNPVREDSLLKIIPICKLQKCNIITWGKG